jgi:hypothetical protein
VRAEIVLAMTVRTPAMGATAMHRPFAALQPSQPQPAAQRTRLGRRRIP